jgi:5-methyltetrahydrofolate--homocysteine methyltransferase
LVRGRADDNASRAVGNAGQVPGNAGQVADNAGQDVGNAGQDVGNARQVAGNARQVAGNARQDVDNAGQVVDNAGQAVVNVRQDVDTASRADDNAGQAVVNARQVVDNARQDVDNARQDVDNAGQDVDNAGQVADTADRAVDNTGQVVDNAGQVVDNAGQDVDNAGRDVDNARQDVDNAGQDVDNAGQDVDNAGRDVDNPGQVWFNVPMEQEQQEDTAAVLNGLVRERILVLDGAMGSLIREKARRRPGAAGPGASDPEVSDPGTSGCLDMLCLTRPELISSIHDAYLEAGADIVTSCSFSANAVSLGDYDPAGLPRDKPVGEAAYDISRAAGALARQAADRYSTPDRPRFAAGSMGPSSKSGSISPDVDDPGRRGVTWDELEQAYYDNARGLLDGGVHILLLETIFDTLNAKAAIAAILRLREERNRPVPLILSATVADASGRILSGQTLEAFTVSTAHGAPFAIGLNCSLGAETMLPYLKTLAAAAPFPVSCYPNAGLPGNNGTYGEGPEETASLVRVFMEQGLVNIIGGCCGTTPEHIARLAELAREYPPRRFPPEKALLCAGGGRKTFLAGLEILPVDRDFIDIGERTNVAGSKKFLRLVQNENWEAALDTAREMIDAGAGIIDVCMDDALLDGKEAMVRFLSLALADPEIAKVPVMPDSSRWEILEAALKCIQGKGIVNSVSLKEGEGEFLRRARLVRRYGAALVVMLFDEEGQAISYERRTAVAERSYRLLTGAGFPPEDIVFDPNVLTIATGMAEHDRYALDFIRAVSWIREHCPGARVSGGVSNLSFSFRGNGEIRRALHAVFLNHAVKAGLSMAILNPAGLVSCDEIPAGLREAAEDAILCRRPGNMDPGEELDYAERILALGGGGGESPGASPGGESSAEGPIGDGLPEWRNRSPADRIVHALVKGIDKYIGDDVLELRESGRGPLEIIEGFLMKGIEEVGRRFGEGSMFLPQVIRSARVMKKAVTVLEPFMSAGSGGPRSAGTIVMATVKGDVHDIGKNITSVILGCNGYRVIDLGVMVPGEKILAAARESRADCIGLSALISPSLDEMVQVAREMEKGGFTVPLLIGGAAASVAHTALRIAPEYSGPVVYVRDAGQSAPVVRSLLSPRRRPAFLEELESEYAGARQRHDSIGKRRTFLSLEEARANRPRIDWDDPASRDPAPKTKGIVEFRDYPAEELFPWIDWEQFYAAWELPGASAEPGIRETVSGRAREKLSADAEWMLEKIAAEKILSLRAAAGFFPAFSENEDLVLYGPGGTDGPELGRFCFLRNQEKKSGPNPCLADFIPPRPDTSAAASGGRTEADAAASADAPSGWLGLFALSAGFGLESAAAAYREQGDDYNALLLALLADRLAEAFSEKLHERVRRELWAYAPEENLTPPELFAGRYRGIRPAFGYAACPDHRDKETVFRLLEAEKRVGLRLSESAMIIPGASLCGMYFARPEIRYFGAGEIAGDQLAVWARRKGIAPEEARRRAGRI